jgi:hypothetical protein
MEKESPIGFFRLGHKEERSQKFKAESYDEYKTRDAMKNPNKHWRLSFSEFSAHIILKR